MHEKPLPEPLKAALVKQTTEPDDSQTNTNDTASKPAESAAPNKDARPTEYGGQKGLEPTRYGDWEKNGRCTDF